MVHRMDGQSLLSSTTKGRRLELVAAGAWTVRQADQIDSLIDHVAAASGHASPIASASRVRFRER